MDLEPVCGTRVPAKAHPDSHRAELHSGYRGGRARAY
jgi:hypothetical protein